MGARTAEGPRRGVRGRSAVPTAPISSWSTASLFKALSMAAAALSHCPGGRGGGGARREQPTSPAPGDKKSPGGPSQVLTQPAGKAGSGSALLCSGPA